MLKIKNGGLDQYGTEPFKQLHIRTAGTAVVKLTQHVSGLENSSHDRERIDLFSRWNTSNEQRRVTTEAISNSNIQNDPKAATCSDTLTRPQQQQSVAIASNSTYLQSASFRCRSSASRV